MIGCEFAALPSPVVTLLPASGLNANIGEPSFLQCRAHVVNNLWMHPIMEWLLPNRSRVTSIPTILETGKPSSWTAYADTLYFDSIQYSDRGLYSCNVSITVPDSPLTYNASMTSVNVARKCDNYKPISPTRSNTIPFSF